MTRDIKTDEQSNEAEVVRLRTPPRAIWIDLMTGTTCDPDPIENGGQVIPFTVPSSRVRGKDKAKDKQIAKQNVPSPTK
jgi:hypothetical protein